MMLLTAAMLLCTGSAFVCAYCSQPNEAARMQTSRPSIIRWLP